jgi:hypothetical protein
VNRVRFVTGARRNARELPKYDSPRAFLASYHGKCRRCGKLYQPGDPIYSPGQGQGAYHPKCFRKKGQFG